MGDERQEPDTPFAPMLGGYLDSLMGTDRMIGQLAGSRWMNEDGGIFALYGDHQPSLPVLMNDGAHIGASTDYFILDRTRPAGPRHDIRVDQLGRELAGCLMNHTPLPRAVSGR